MLYRITEGTVTRIASTSVPEEALYEEHVENWVASCPEMLGEQLLIIGRQVQLDEGQDRIDLLAIDQAGNLVVVELKRDLIGGSADLQALRYAALVSRWTHDDVRGHAEGYWRSHGETRGTFAQEVEKLCGEEYEINGRQRIILVGRDIKPRLGTMALWLRSQGVDVTVAGVSLMRDGDRLYAQPQIVIPVPSEDRFQGKVAIGSSDKPWLIDGQAWHLEQRCSPQGREIVERLVELIGEAVPEANGPSWTQKLYISWRFGNKIWASVGTGSPNRASLNFDLTASHEQVAEQLEYAVFEGDATLSEKLALGSSVGRVGDGNTLRLIIKSPADLAEQSATVLTELLRRSWAEHTNVQAAGPAAVVGSAEDGDGEIAMEHGDEFVAVPLGDAS